MLFLELAKPAVSSGLPKILDKGVAADPASCLPGWRAVLDFHGTPGLWNDAIEQVLIRWLDAALRNSRMRPRIIAVLVAAASPPMTFRHERWIVAAQLAQRLGVSRETVRRLAIAGTLPHTVMCRGARKTTRRFPRRFADDFAASGLEVADLAGYAAAWRARVTAPGR